MNDIQIQRRFERLPVAQAVLLVLASSMPVSVLAQSEKIEEVVISAQKRTERLQDVPVAVKAFTATQIEDAGIKSTQDFINMTPNMSFDQSFTYNNSFVTLRGVTQINNADSPVAIVVDGVPQGNQKQLRMDLYDIERIEILKGPQGALYGRNAIGGAINIETKKPTGKFEGFGSLGFGNAGARQYGAGVSGTLKEDVAFYRLALSGKSSDGMINNNYLNQKVDRIKQDDNFRARFLLLPSSDVSIDLRASQNTVSAGATMDAIVNGGPSLIAFPQSNMLGQTNGSTSDYSMKIDYETPKGKMTAITAYTNLSERYRGDLDFTYSANPDRFLSALLPAGVGLGQGQNLGVKMWSQEVRWTSPAKQPFRYIVGAYYLDTRRSLETRGFLDLNGALNQYDVAAQVPDSAWSNESNHNKAPAYFAQFDYDLTQQLTFTGGLRYDKDMRNQLDVRTGNSRSASFSKWQPKVNLSHKLGQDEQIYGTVSSGFRSGGFNAPVVNPGIFQPESLTNHEVGYKTIAMDGRLMFNAAAFISKSTNFQYFQVDASTAKQVILNIDKVELKGIDLDWRYRLDRSWEFDGGIGYTESTIKAFNLHPQWVGNHTPKNVPLKINMGLQYSRVLSDEMKSLVRVDWEHRSQKYWHPDNVDVSPALNLINLRMAISEKKDAWSVALTGRNIFNKQYYADFNSRVFSGLPYNIGSLAMGRTVLLEGKVRF
jgi:iron complex outermembrane receptor protein